LMDQDGANVRYLTRGDDLVLTPRFSPSTQEITYMSFGQGEPRVYLLNVESGQREVVGNFPGMSFSPRFSPDGQRVIMSLQQGGNANLFAMDLRSRTTTRLTDTPAIDTAPCYSPDGARICFESDRGGKQQIYVMSANGGAAQRISFGEGSYSTPVWSPRGDFIAFTKQGGGQFGIGVIRPEGTRWVEGFGLADLEQGLRASGDTIAMWASSSKVVTAAAAMKAMETKGIALDAPVNAHLPFKVGNPGFPETPITFRMLLTHTSSILYNLGPGNSLYADGDATMPLGEFLREYLVPAGRFYKRSNYGASAPGSVWVYSNINASLLGYLVERITGTPFNEFCRRALFAPLGMREASWFLRDLDVSHLAVQYRAPRASGASRRVASYHWPGYPDGMLRCSARDMLRMMGAFLGGAGLDGKPVLSPAIVAEMFTPQGIDRAQLKGRSPIVSLDHGLAWRLLDLDGRRIWSHNGNGSGMTTAVLLDDKTRAAAVVWITGGVLETPEGQAFFLDLHHRLLAEMERS